LLGACVDYAGPLPEQDTESNQPTTRPSSSTPPATTPTTMTPPSTTPAGTEMDDEVVSFDRDVHPILVERCGMCHEGVAPALPDHGAADSDVAFAATQGMSNDEPVYQRILARASGDDPIGPMPPGCAGAPGSAGGCLTQEEFELIERWVEQGASAR
jgi:uncharacterized membrane protein